MKRVVVTKVKREKGAHSRVVHLPIERILKGERVVGREDGEMPWIRALCSRCGEYETVNMAWENVGKWGMRRKQGWLCGINRARRTVRARQAWCRHNPGSENNNSTRVEHARQRVKTGQGVLKQKSPDSFSARGSLSSSPDRACTIEGGQSCGLERFSLFEEGTPCVEGKKIRENGSTPLPGARDAHQRHITGLARASCMPFLTQRRCGVPICQEVGTKALLG